MTISTDEIIFASTGRTMLSTALFWSTKQLVNLCTVPGMFQLLDPNMWRLIIICVLPKHPMDIYMPYDNVVSRKRRGVTLRSMLWFT